MASSTSIELPCLDFINNSTIGDFGLMSLESIYVGIAEAMSRCSSAKIWSSKLLSFSSDTKTKVTLLDRMPFRLDQ